MGDLLTANPILEMVLIDGGRVIDPTKRMEGHLGPRVQVSFCKPSVARGCW